NLDIDKLTEDTNIEVSINNRYYSTNIKNIKELGFRQVYLHDITKRHEFEKQIKDYQNNLKDLHNKVDSANEEEKLRIGKELHDGVGHSLSLLKMEMQNFFMKNNHSLEEENANKLLTTIDKLSGEIREISHQLKPRILSEFGLVPALRSLIDRTNSQGKMIGYVSQEKEFKLKDKKLEQNIYRICQEALNNIIKHSECDEFHIDIKNYNNTLKLVISDDGKGFNVGDKMRNGKTSLGLLNMKERAEAVGGNLSIDSIENMGTTIYLSVNSREDLYD
ncbi:MAG: sensor histidine kinase, partial [Melioribacteraceae bacterium]|nr:sensor histidine kinase [Melioribacteraceae bacterium]